MAVQFPTEQAPTIVPAGIWKVDPAHSAVEFAVKHMMIATVKGRFTEFDGTLLAEDGPESAKVNGAIIVASIDTHESQRDGHLRSPASSTPRASRRSGSSRSGSSTSTGPSSGSPAT